MNSDCTAAETVPAPMRGLPLSPAYVATVPGLARERVALLAHFARRIALEAIELDCSDQRPLIACGSCAARTSTGSKFEHHPDCNVVGVLRALDALGELGRGLEFASPAAGSRIAYPQETLTHEQAAVRHEEASAFPHLFVTVPGAGHSSLHERFVASGDADDALAPLIAAFDAPAPDAWEAE